MGVTVWKPEGTYGLNQLVYHTGQFYKSLINNNNNEPVIFIENNQQNTSGVIIDKFDYIPQIHQSWQLIENLI